MIKNICSLTFIRQISQSSKRPTNKTPERISLLFDKSKPVPPPPFTDGPSLDRFMEQAAKEALKSIKRNPPPKSIPRPENTPRPITIEEIFGNKEDFEERRTYWKKKLGWPS